MRESVCVCRSEGRPRFYFKRKRQSRKGTFDMQKNLKIFQVLNGGSDDDDDVGVTEMQYYYAV